MPISSNQHNFTPNFDSKPSSSSNSDSSKAAETQFAELLALEVERESRLMACMRVLPSSSSSSTNVSFHCKNNSLTLPFSNVTGIKEVETIIPEEIHEESMKLSSSPLPLSLSSDLDEENLEVDNDQNNNPGDVFEWKLPGSVRYLSSYLEQQKEHILYELMSLVTLSSINHENICCVNTSILILIYAHKR